MSDAENTTREKLVDVLFEHSVDRPDQKTGGVVCDCGWGPDGWFTYSEHIADALIAAFPTLTGTEEAIPPHTLTLADPLCSICGLSIGEHEEGQ